MSRCQIEEINAGGAYPRFCPTCGLAGNCVKGFPHPFKKAGELPDAIRVPLHSLWADAGYLVGRAMRGDGELAVATIKKRCDEIEAAVRAALSRQACEEAADLIEAPAGSREPAGPLPVHQDPALREECSAGGVQALSVRLIALAAELDAELDSGAKWSKAQHTCDSVSMALNAGAKIAAALEEQNEQLARALRAEVEAPPFDPETVLAGSREPAGWKLVPIEPSNRMVNEAPTAWHRWKSRDNGGNIQELGSLMWAHMLDAAPVLAGSRAAEALPAQPGRDPVVHQAPPHRVEGSASEAPSPDGSSGRGPSSEKPVAADGGRDALDAARYRWLRDESDPDSGQPYATTHECNDWGKWFNTVKQGGALDAAIDAAKKEQP